MAEIRILNEVGATVIINGEERESVVVARGSHVTWSVTKEGYVGRSGDLDVDEDTVLPVVLKREEYTITFNVSPTDATLDVNSAHVILTGGTYSMTAKDGDVIDWLCECDGYVSKSGSHTVSGDATITITLEDEGDHHIAVDPDTLTLAASGVSAGSRNLVTVDSDGSWTAEADKEWVVLSASEGGSGTTGVTVRAETNTSWLMRLAEVTFTNEWGNTAVLAVTQEGDISSGGDPGGDDPDPEENPDTITASTRAVASGEEFTLTLTGTTATLDATLTNMSATVGTVYLTIDGGDTYELDTQTTSIPVAANSAYRCVLEFSFSEVLTVLFAHGDASVTVTVHQNTTGNSDAEAYSDGGENE